jgi:uncharacterized membrane protein
MTETKPIIDKKDVEENKAIAAIGYVFILCFIPLLMAKDSAFAQYHAKQGFVLFVVEIVIMIISNILVFIPIFGWSVMMILNLAVVILSIVGILKALEGDLWEMPFLGQYAKKLKF